MHAAIAAGRLRNQQIDSPRHRSPADLVAWLGAVQAQDYGAARWAVGLRLRGRITSAAIDSALDRGEILRTHVLRPTWHFVSPKDIHWMLALTGSRVERALATGFRHYELDERLRARARDVIAAALERGRALTRAEIAVHLVRRRIAVAGIRLALLMLAAEAQAIVCSGPRSGRQMTYALLSTRAPKPPRMSREEALAELTTRYFQSHGPATLRDFAWWSGLTAADARLGVQIIGAKSQAVDGLTYWRTVRSSRRATPAPSVHLLPIYDEYLVSYRDLAAVPRRPAAWGRLEQVIVAAGEIIGTWRAELRGGRRDVRVSLDRRLTSAEQRALDDAVGDYRAFEATTP
jgi:hypothetical protein